MKRFNKIYVEIGNVCNLSCSFCPTLKREKRQMTPNEFGVICEKIRPYTDYIYLHLMGEPLLHNELDELLSIAKAQGFKVCITTNGTLLDKRVDLLTKYAPPAGRRNTTRKLRSPCTPETITIRTFPSSGRSTATSVSLFWIS